MMITYEMILTLETHIDNLRDAVDRAKTLVTKYPEQGPRLTSYEELIEKQLGFVEDLKIAYQTNNSHDMIRLINIINELSGMVRNDAQELVKELVNKETFDRGNIN